MNSFSFSTLVPASRTAVKCPEGVRLAWQSKLSMSRLKRLLFKSGASLAPNFQKTLHPTNPEKVPIKIIYSLKLIIAEVKAVFRLQMHLN